MQAELQIITVHRPPGWYEEFAIADDPFVGKPGELGHYIGDRPRQRLAGFGLQITLGAIAEGEAAKAVPCRLVLPAVLRGNFVCRARFHRRQGRLPFLRFHFE